MEEIYKPPKSSTLIKGNAATSGILSLAQAMLIAPLAAPLVLFLIIMIMNIESKGAGFKLGLAEFFTEALLIPLLVSYGLTVVVGGPIYYLLFKFEIVKYWVFSLITVFAVFLLGISVYIIAGQTIAILIVSGVSVAAFLNTSFLWYLVCKRPNNKCKN